VTTRIDERAQAMAPRSARRSFSKSSSGPSEMPRASTGPSGPKAEAHGSPVSNSPVQTAQSSVNAACNWATTGPVMRKWRSWTGWSGSCARQFPSLILMPPVKLTAPSATRILRWVRRFEYWKCQGISVGRNVATGIPAFRSARGIGGQP